MFFFFNLYLGEGGDYWDGLIFINDFNLVGKTKVKTTNIYASSLVYEARKIT